MPDRGKRPSILVFDSGLGGLTVFRATMAVRPDADFTYLADDAGFPYGPLPPAALVARVMNVLTARIERDAPDLVVIACNTASTLVLPPLRAAFPHVPFVGTVPAIKPAAMLSKSRMISVLATPGTVSRDYTRDLVATHAADCAVTLVGAPSLAPLAERFLRDGTIDENAVAREIAACFVSDEARRTDTIVLACTHYPLLLDVLKRCAPWPVDWIDPAPAIARRIVSLLGDADATLRPGARSFAFTSGADADAMLRNVLTAFGFANARPDAVALCA